MDRHLYLMCSNPECPSNSVIEGKNPHFNVTIAVGYDRHPSEDLRKISADQFECIHCGFSAQDEPREIPPLPPPYFECEPEY